MTGSNEPAPVIIRRKRITKSDGHHGGAWKVAYADFVTAMMSFFLMMWLLGATTEEQRKGVADYFNPSVAVAPTGGGGDILAGDSLFSQQTRARSGSGVTEARERSGTGMGSADPAMMKAEVDAAFAALTGNGGMEDLMQHIATRISDEGLVIEIYDIDSASLFTGETARPERILRQIADMLADVLAITTNDVAINGHMRAYPVVLVKNPVWDLSSARAGEMRRLLQNAGFPPARLQRVTGYADRKPVTADPMAIRNNRLEVILLRRPR